MSYEITYKDLPRWQADDKAIEDFKFFVGDKTFNILREEADKGNWRDINNSCGFIGVKGYPVHAFGRRYCLTAYREWMHEGDDAVMTDEQGFKLKDEDNGQRT